MKRWIHASTRDIDYKTKDYIAAWAKYDAKQGNEMSTFRQFKEEMKSKGLKADEDDYDYYVTCYNNACSNSNTTVKASSDLDDYRFSYHFRIYELDEDGDEIDVVDSADTLDKAIEVAKNAGVRTHIVFCPDVDPDDDPEIAEWYEYNSEYVPYEIVWESMGE